MWTPWTPPSPASISSSDSAAKPAPRGDHCQGHLARVHATNLTRENRARNPPKQKKSMEWVGECISSIYPPPPPPLCIACTLAPSALSRICFNRRALSSTILPSLIPSLASQVSMYFHPSTTWVGKGRMVGHEARVQNASNMQSKSNPSNAKRFSLRRRSKAESKG